MDDYGEFLAFRKMITPMIIQIIFWIGVAVCVIGGLVMIASGVNGSSGITVLMGLLYILLGPLLVRICCDLVIVIFHIFDELKGIRGALAPATGFPVMPVQPIVPPEVR